MNLVNLWVQSEDSLLYNCVLALVTFKARNASEWQTWQTESLRNNTSLASKTNKNHYVITCSAHTTHALNPPWHTQNTLRDHVLGTHKACNKPTFTHKQNTTSSRVRHTTHALHPPNNPSTPTSTPSLSLLLVNYLTTPYSITLCGWRSEDLQISCPP